MFTRRLDLNGLLKELQAETPVPSASQVSSGPRDW
jgi:hypothetical protein